MAMASSEIQKDLAGKLVQTTHKFHIKENWKEMLSFLRSKPLIEAYEESYKQSGMRQMIYDSIQGEEYQIQEAMKDKQEMLQSELLKYKEQFEELEFSFMNYEMNWMKEIEKVEPKGVKETAEHFAALKGTRRMISEGIRRDEDVFNAYITHDIAVGGKEWKIGVPEPKERKVFLLAKKDFWNKVLDEMAQSIERSEAMEATHKETERQIIFEEKEILKSIDDTR